MRPRLIATLFVPLLAALPASAQLPPPPIGSMGPMMLTNKTIQGELKLSDDQVKKAEDWTRAMSAKSREFFLASQNAPVDQRREMMIARVKQMGEESLAFLSGTLKPEQAARLRQIEIQARGISAFEDPGIQAQLKLSPEQKEKIAALKTELTETAQEIRNAAPDDREIAGARFREAAKAIATRAADSLTDEQKTLWRGILGKPFDVQAAFANPRG